jgi:transposase
MHDNAPIHRAKIIRAFLIEHGITIMDWPTYSPDLNPIENLWSMLKQQIYRYYPELLDAGDTAEVKEDLINAAIDVWDRLGDDLLAKLSDTMPHRVKAVLKVDGWYTKY